MLRSLISAFVIPLLESIISKLATSKILIVQLVSVDEETGLSLALLETSKTGFVVLRPIVRPGFITVVNYHITLHFSGLTLAQNLL